MSMSNVIRLPSIPSLSWDDCRLLVESVVDYAIFMLDAEGRVATWNIGAEKIKGYRADEIVGEHFSKFYTEEDLAVRKPDRKLEIAREVGRVEDEGWRVRKDGSRFWANVVITALRDETGTLRGYGKVTRDLTARRTAETELHRAEQRFHHLVDAVSDYAIFMLDETGHIATWNSGARRLKGYVPEEIIGAHFSAFYTSEDRVAGKPDRILDTVRREGRYQEQGWRVRKDGARFWANVVITALRDEGGTLLGFAKVTQDLTDRRRAEEDLRRSEERFRLLVENVADYAIYMLDVEGRITTWNLGAERMKGYTAAEIIGQTFVLFFPEEDVASGKPARELAAAREHGRFEDEGWRIRQDGSRFWANAVLTALFDVHGELLGFAKITRDLTARRNAEERSRLLLREQTAREVAEEAEARLRQSEARYRALSNRLEIVLEGVADGITVQDRTGRVVFANSAAAKICGFASGQELVNTPPAEVVARFQMLDVEGRPFIVENLPGRLALAGKGPSSAVVHVRERASGRDWWVLIRASAVLDADGQPELAISIWHDVTNEHRGDRDAQYLAQATSALASSLVSDEMLSTLGQVLVPGLGDWCCIYLLEGNSVRQVTVAHADPAKAALAEEYRRRYPPDPEHAGGVWSGIRSSGRSQVLNDITGEMLSLSTTDPQGLATLRSLGMKAALLVPISVRDRTLGVIALVSAETNRRYDPNDVVLAEELGRRAGVALEHAQLYQAAKSAAAAAERAAKTAEQASRAKDEFLAIVSHELRTPLNAIMGWAKLLKTRDFDEPKRATAIDTIERNSVAMAQLIEDLLDMSRVISGKMRLEVERVDLGRVVEAALNSVRPAAVVKAIELVPIIEAPTPPVMGDATRLQQIVWNLLSNAVKFSSKGGRVDVLLRSVGSRVEITVTDRGKGISPTFLPWVFDPFRQEDASPSRMKGGLGLGLAITRQLVELHGGRITAASDGEDCGSTFTVRLPIAAVALAETRSQAITRPHPEHLSFECPDHIRGLRILVVDDEEDSRRLVATVLEDCACVVTTAGSVQEAMTLLATQRLDLLVSDIGMPGEDGYDLIRRVRALPHARGGDMPAAALTAYARAEDRQRMLNAGYSIHLAKPVEPAELVAVVATLSRFLHRAGDDAG